MRCASRSLTYWFSPSGTYGLVLEDQPNTADQVFLSGLILCGLLVLFQRRSRWPQLLRSNGWMVALFAYMALSVLWAPDTFVSMKRWIRVAGDLVMALIVLSEADALEAVWAVLRRTAYLHVPLSLVLSKYFPALGRLGSKSWEEPDMWIGVSVQKNAMAEFLIFPAIFFVWSLMQARRQGRPLIKLPVFKLPVEVVYLVMMGYLLLVHQARSTTSLAALVLGLTMLFLLGRGQFERRRFWLPVLGLVVACIGASLVCQVLTNSSLSALALKLQGKDATLTGREDFWPILINFGMRHPILGAGYGGFWTQQMRDYFLDLHVYGFIPHAHNGYIETFVNLGFVGLVLLAGCILKAFVSAWRMLPYDFEYARMRISLLAAILLHNYTEAGFPRDNNIVWFVFLMMALNVPGREGNQLSPLIEQDLENRDGQAGQLRARAADPELVLTAGAYA